LLVYFTRELEAPPASAATLLEVIFKLCSATLLYA